MTWQQRIREAAYTSPNGDRLVFDYEDVGQTFDKQTAAFNFPAGAGTYVQDLGRTSRRFPFRVFFWGDDYDLRAEAFEAILEQQGVGQLEHPIYGFRYVVPFGTVTRRDDLKTAGNQAVFEVTFYETIRSVYPSSVDDPRSDVAAALVEFNNASSAAFADAVNLNTESQRVTLKNTFLSFKNAAVSALQTIADTQDDVRNVFLAIDNSINTGIDLLVSEPLDLAFQGLRLIQAPSRALTDIQARLSAYGDLADALFNRESVATNNDFRVGDLNGAGYVSGSVSSTLNTTFTTKPEALSAADAFFDQFDAWVAWREAEFENLGAIDTGETYQQLQQVVALAAGFLIEISFTLKQERRIVTDRARTVVDLCFELTGSLDDLDFFIASNSFSGSELLELPRGTNVVYYV